MAVVAQFSPLLGYSKGLLRGRGLMACIALHGGHWIMDARFQKFGLNRRVGGVASVARGVVYRIIPVSLLKRCLAAVVAAKAKRSLCFCQEILLVRTVGNMTGPASLG